ncbi:DUF4349 domain-containing protein [Chloroflexota bacterium]
MKKSALIITALLVTCLLVTASCAASTSEEYVPIGPSSIPIETGSSAQAPEIYKGEGELVYNDSSMSTADEGRMIVRTGDMSLIVEDVVETRDEIVRIADTLGGYTVSSRVWGEEEEKRGWISIRVPDDSFDQTMTDFRSLAIRVDSESANNQDVTEQYIDLESRLRNAEATENQYFALLDKATNVEDTLQIYNSLSQIRREIDQITGQMQYLERTTSMSLITVSLSPATTAKPLVRAGWNIVEAFKSAIRGIVVFGQFLGSLAVWLLILTPVWGTILGIVIWQKRKRKAKAKE